MAKIKQTRKIIDINLKKCNGCGLCVPDCPEGALQIIDGKVRLVSDLFCDGLGACIKSCPRDAIRVIEREAEPYDEKKVMQNVIKQGENTILAHLIHLKDHGELKYLEIAKKVLKEKKLDLILKKFDSNKTQTMHAGCPGSKAMVFETKSNLKNKKVSNSKSTDVSSKLRQWPIQLHLINPNASYFNNADILIAADCAAFSYGNFHNEFIDKKSIAIACPKLDETDSYVEKLAILFKQNNIKQITVAFMEVPCCGGLDSLVREALQKSGKKIPIKSITISLQGEIL